MAAEEPTVDSLPLIDLRLLSQSELFSLSLSASSASATHRCQDDVVIPKIDRSVFNESAGSRKQTFSRLRLAPRNHQKQPSATAITASASSFHIPLHIPEPLDDENSQIIDLLQRLFGVESLRKATRHEGVDDHRLVPVQVELEHPESDALAFQNIPIDVVIDEGGSGTKRKRGRPRKKENLEAFVEEEEPPKTVNGDGEGGMEVTVIEEKGFVADAVDLTDVGDPVGEEVKRRTQGLVTEAQVMEFLESLNGEWGSQRKKRRIVQASGLGDLLPAGWKIVLSVQRRAGRVSIVCSRYVSPDGHQFASYKEVSVYLLSFFGVQDTSHLTSSYTDGSLHFSSNINMASGSVFGHVPAGDVKADPSASGLHLASTYECSHHEKQATVASSMGSQKLNSSEGNSNSDLALDCILGDTSGAFIGIDHQIEDKQPLKDDKDDAKSNSVQGCSLEEDGVHGVHNEKFVGTVEASDAACNLYIPLVFSTPFSDNNSGIYQFSDEINAFTFIQSGTSNFAGQERNSECYEAVPCGNEQAHVDNNGHGVSVRLMEDHRQKAGFDSSMLYPNSEGKKYASSNLEDRHHMSSLEYMEISDGKAEKDNNEQIISISDQSGIKDVSTNVKVQSSSEGFSLVPSQNELKHMSINSSDRIQTSLLKDSAEGKCLENDLPIHERIWVPSGCINDVSSQTCRVDASESGGVHIGPNLKVAKVVSDNGALPNKDVVARSTQESSSLNDQNCKIDNPLHRSSGSNLLTPTGNWHPFAFDNNLNDFSAGTFDALKAVDAGYKNPQLGIVFSSNDVAVDAYTATSIMQDRSLGCESVPLGGNILNQFDEQSDNGVSNANKSCLSEKAENEQIKILQTDSMGVPEFR